MEDMNQMNRRRIVMTSMRTQRIMKIGKMRTRKMKHFLMKKMKLRI